ncbi:MAG: response regulator transcription factor [Anaerolineaceae bacterium]|nr:response regulator transcription factor [Anaerolineaceae bacterium]
MSTPLPPPLESLIEALELLLQQARAYESILPPENYQARGVVSALSESARKALAEAQTLVEVLSPPAPGRHPFTPREFQVLQLAAQGNTNKEIAYRLGISDRTVQFHLNSIFNKTGTSSRTEVVALAVKNGWL